MASCGACCRDNATCTACRGRFGPDSNRTVRRHECVALACRQAECEKLPGCEQSHALLARLAPKLRKTFQKHAGARL